MPVRFAVEPVRACLPSQKACSPSRRNGTAQTKAAVIKLSKNTNIKGLRLEPLEGRVGFWKARVNDNFRILIQLEEGEEGAAYRLLDVGSHDIHYRR